MPTYAFNSKEVAEALSDIGRQAMANNMPSEAPLGREIVVVKTPTGGIAARVGTTCTAEDCTRVYVSGGDGDLSEQSDLIVPVVNMTDQNLGGDEFVSVFRIGTFWVYDGASEAAPKRVKFKLNAPLYNYPVGNPSDDGTGAATVIDPMNSGLAIGDTIQSTTSEAV